MAELPSAATSKVLPTEATSKVIPADLRRRLRAESWQRAKQMRLLYALEWGLETTRGNQHANLGMRVTIKLDDDTARLIRDEMRRTQRSFKVTLNEAIRSGLARAPENRAVFRVIARPLGLRAGVDPARMHQRDQDAEEERFLRVTHRALLAARQSSP